MTPEIEELLAAAEAIPTSTEVDIQWIYRLHRAARAVRQNNGDPIETGREAALGQWEARWEALRHYLADEVVMPVGRFYADYMDRIEAAIPTGLAVGERWVPRMTGRVNIQLEPERLDRLIELLPLGLHQGDSVEPRDMYDADALAEDITNMKDRP